MDRVREMGLELREARKASGLSVEELSRKTRISSRYIIWLEDGELEHLPGGVFLTGFIRTICRETKCDADRMLALLEPEEAEEVMEEPAAEGRRQTPLILTGVILLVLVAGAFMMMGGRDDPPAVGQEAGSADVVEEEAADAAAPDDIISPEESAHPEEMDLVIRATDNTWLKIQADDKEPWETTMKPGDEVRLSAMENVSLYIGNAGGLMFELNGRTFGPPGATGQVIKSYVITRDNL
jgi:cytoskeletal protein RodZ